MRKKHRSLPVKKMKIDPAKRDCISCLDVGVGLNSDNNGENNHHCFVQGPFFNLHYPFCKVFGQEVKDPNLFDSPHSQLKTLDSM